MRAEVHPLRTAQLRPTDRPAAGRSAGPSRFLAPRKTVSRCTCRRLSTWRNENRLFGSSDVRALPTSLSETGVLTSSAHSEGALHELWDKCGALPRWPSAFSLEATPKGRGVVVRRGQALHEGGTVLSVPLTSAVFVSEATPGIAVDTHLALKLLHEIRSPGSIFSQYASLISEDIHSGAVWTERELSQLQCEAVADSARCLRDHAESQFEELQYFEADDFRTLAAGVAWEEFQWAMCVVHSRSFSVAVPEGPMVRAIVPFCDMFNHSCHSPEPASSGHPMGSGSRAADDCVRPHAWELQKIGEELRFVVTAAYGVPEGSEVFISYGRKKNADLLVEYGFVESVNPCERVVLYDSALDLIDDDEYRPADSVQVIMLKEELIQAAVPPLHYLAMQPDGSFDHLLGLLRVLYAHPDDLPLLKQSPDHIEGCDLFTWAVDSDAVTSRMQACDDAARSHIGRRCEELLEDFPTTVEEDAQLLESLTVSEADKGDDENGPSTYRLRTAITFRMQMKRALLAAVTSISYSNNITVAA